MSLDGLPPAHLRVLLDGLPVFERYGLLLAGGYAFRAHEILHRPSQDLDFATRDGTPLPEIAAQVQLAFQRAGYGVRITEASPRYARLVVRLPSSGEELEMDLLWVNIRSRNRGLLALFLFTDVGRDDAARGEASGRYISGTSSATSW